MQMVVRHQGLKRLELGPILTLIMALADRRLGTKERIAGQTMVVTAMATLI